MKLKKSLKIIVLTLTAFVSLGAIIPVSAPAFADTTSNVCDLPDNESTKEVKKAAGCSGSNDGLFTVIRNILSAIIGVVGLVSAIYVVVGGVNYMTANGDVSKLEKAKKTILYALIGLIVAALAFTIVQFVVTDIVKAPEKQ